VLIELGVADGEQDCGVVLVGSEVGRAWQVGYGVCGDRDVEPEGELDDVAVLGVGADHVDHDAVGGRESEHGCGGGDDVGGVPEFDGHVVFSVSVVIGAPVSAGGAVNRVRVGGQPRRGGVARSRGFSPRAAASWLGLKRSLGLRSSTSVWVDRSGPRPIRLPPLLTGR